MMVSVSIEVKHLELDLFGAFFLLLCCFEGDIVYIV